MTASEALDRLATLAGIEDGWWDFFGAWRPVPAETKRVFLAAMGFAVAGDDDIAASLAELDARPWRRWLEPVAVLEQGAGRDWVELTLPAARDKDLVTWRLQEELGPVHSGQVQVDGLDWAEERWLDGALVKRWRLHLPALPPLGYHRLTVVAADGAEASMVLAVAPARAYVPPAVAAGHRAWGVATQIYALRTPGDWGVGTYKALETLAAGAAKLGAATVGINPLHALFANLPDRFSPYAPSSRRFLNVAYIDVEAIPEFAESREAGRMFASPGFQANLARVRGYPLVDYPEVARLSRPMLDILYRHFRTAHLAEEDERGRAFRAFQAQGGDFARLFCTFEALQENVVAAGGSTYWHQWPEKLRHPHSAAVTAFAEANRERVEFFWWLQFVADEQLGAAQRAGIEAGAGIGLYRDLGVGIAGDGAEAWLEQDNLALGVSVGAPPDPLALKGQDWGLMPFNPIALKEAAYAPFIGVMAANMRHAGALRLDHAMALTRLYWVPPGASADQGAYVRYPTDDLFRLVALESVRNRCLIIGEDLGTVPEGFRERMDSMDLFAYRVMVFEQTDGRFKWPTEFDEKALTTFATHDLPSVRGWWNGADVALRRRLDLYPREDMAEGEALARQADREKLVHTLSEEGLLPEDFPTKGVMTDAQADILAEAAHLYLARVRSRLMMVQIEDVLALDTQMNLPGTTDQHPNWRLRFPVELEVVLADPRLKALARRLADGRGTKR
ncbi:4-alpha-glucanotransferase [Magnetospirillum sp. UT-4]|uniref:4-alpha-glucanotransferase n=1 Tax=Magnetospirillum sp. UT-4 TaxID=2681467 RepID=UPI00138043C1|nr:4-alpha-glucanotransferase [Magnetospirillum sp. UT-4]CAA7619813.1 putative 4-alpha-glucanotransferase [Magnetospirillum sp. UT-4]